MSQCVPSWDLDDNPIPSRLALRSHSNSSSHPDVPMSDYEVAELTWENGQPAIHGLGPPKSILSKLTATTTPSTTSHIQNNSIKYAPSWPDKPRATTGTLESIVNQATRFTPTTIPLRKSPVAAVPFDDSDELVPWFDHNRSSCSAAASTSATMTRDALVPCSDPTTEDRATGTHAIGTCVVGCATRVGSSSAPATHDNEGVKRARVGARVEWSGRDVHSVSGSATIGRGRDRESRHVTLDTCERELGVGGAVGVGFTSTSLGGSQTQDNTSYGKPTNTGKTVTADENDSVCHSTPQRQAGDGEGKKKANGKSSVSTKRSRAAAIHNQSERKRRDKINQRLKTLQKLVPNSSKTDKASMLDEVIDYLKQLQAQVQMMSRMNMQPMMLPMALQQQLQMSMMAPMSMGMGMGMGMGVMDMNTIAGRPNIPGISPVLHPSAFMPIASWDGSGAGDRLPAASAAVIPDPFSAFLASQPITMDAYSRMVAMYQQLYQPPPASSSKS